MLPCRSRNPFELAPPSAFDRALTRLRFRECYSQAALAPTLDATQRAAVDALRREGTVTLERHISPPRLREMQQELQETLDALQFETPCLAQTRIDPVRHRALIDNFLYGSPQQLKAAGAAFDRDEVHSLEQVVRDFNPSTLTVYMLERSQAFREVWLDPYVLGIVAAYLGMLPKLAEGYVRRNYPSPWRTMNHFWHRDLNHRFLLCKAFIFLNDCTVDNGPHEFVRGSHADFARLNGKRYFTDEEVDAAFPVGSAQRLVSEVPAGSIIIEDTRGVHRARMPAKGFRDLGYAVFVPLPAGFREVYYTFPRAACAGLSRFQRAFLPEANLV